MAPFKINPTLTAIAQAYQNKAFIADLVMPRKPVGAQEFRYIAYDKSDRFTVPDTLVGRTGRPSEITFGASERTGSTVDYGLEAPIPQRDIDSAKDSAGYNPKGHHTEMVSELILLDREQRVSNMVQSTDNYDASRVENLSGTSLWSDPDSTPLRDILDALEEPLIRPNMAITNRKVMRTLRTHPALIRAYNRSLGEDGLIPVAFLTELFEINFIIGESKINTATRGKTAEYDQLWGSKLALIHQNPNARPEGDATWGLTAQWGTRMGYEKFDDSIGLRGGVRIKVGESVNELVIAKDVGFLFNTCI
jgi:hypothetical protein